MIEKLLKASATVLLLGGSAAFASPQADARYIAQRSMEQPLITRMERHLKSAFVSVYARPLAEYGVRIKDRQRFIDLIPDEDVGPYMEEYFARNIRLYESLFTPEQLSSLAFILREDEQATLEDILSDPFVERYKAALQQAQSADVEQPRIAELEELFTQLSALRTAFSDEETAEAFGQVLTLGAAPIFALVGYSHDIARTEVDIDNPVTRAALQSDSILGFANPVQRQILLGQLSSPEESNRARFVKPPT